MPLVAAYVALAWPLVALEALRPVADGTLLVLDDTLLAFDGTLLALDGTLPPVAGVLDDASVIDDHLPGVE